MIEPLRPTHAKIHLNHLVQNLTILRQELGAPFFCPMVKANAYGHGDIPVANALSQQGVNIMGVGLVEEGLHLRQGGYQGDLLFFGITDHKNVEVLIQTHQIPVISNRYSLEVLQTYLRQNEDTYLRQSRMAYRHQSEGADLRQKEEVPLGENKEANLAAYPKTNPWTFPIHIKLDTGMHRFGFSPEQEDEVLDWLVAHPHFEVQGLMTHLATGEDIESPQGFARQQLMSFEYRLKKWKQRYPQAICHALNSAGVLGALNDPAAQLNRWGARPGMALYGVLPIAKRQGRALRPVMSLHSKIIHVAQLKKWETVSYGRHWTAPQDSWMGVIPMGYADGLPRALSNRCFFQIAGQLVPQIGNITMDNVIVDLTSLKGKYSLESLMFKDIVLLGEGSSEIHMDYWAQQSSSISWEIMTRIGERVPRFYVSNL